jgi:hypothetical protein
MWHAWERGEGCTAFWGKSPKERDHFKDQGIGGRVGLEWILVRLVREVRSGFTWLKIGTSGGIL